MVLKAGEDYTPMTQEEQEEAIIYARGQGFTPLFPE
jgi:hypothetical protein